ncbi:acyl-protein synthetase [Paenibacillus sp. NFR01]|uniref:LuxE/PaaK family acyltransferase n=1 Tax=Paenibacillus sp. NFR01 TaxID=1566279 RepID=UPI0008AF9CFD|nr:acyl-protein synthetase [Paenibacillus sp. NFR01]SEU10077.1 Phenylacetate-coenzyme A ligase PaaK, adenylate-forming domain family [Paenibacillus sp. NFR01]
MIDQILSSENPYKLSRDVKEFMLLKELRELTDFHYRQCLPYQRILDKTSAKIEVNELTELPFLPVQLFKMLDLFSMPEEERFKILNSSGTTGQQVSRIHIDKLTSEMQTKALNLIVRSYLGKKRLPMIIADTNLLKNRSQFSARLAGTIGFSQFGHHHLYLFDEDMKLKEAELLEFLQKYKGEKIFIFGFTYIIWEFLLNNFKRSNRILDLEGSILIHGGGWKKLQNQAVSDGMFRDLLKEQFNISQVYDYYGMVEQVGSIYMQCEHGHLHTPDFADILIRDEETLKPVPYGTEGLIQVLSILPRSYPGHSLLTEDRGTILGEDDCECGRKGKYFIVHGRLPKAEARGCSDTFTLT